EGDQPFVLAAVVPAEPMPARLGQKAVQGAQYRLVITEFGLLLLPGVIIVGQQPGEPGRWGELVVVAGDDQPLAAHDGRDRVVRLNLAGLVEDHEVEEASRGEHLTDHERGHRPAWP